VHILELLGVSALLILLVSVVLVIVGEDDIETELVVQFAYIGFDSVPEIIVENPIVYIIPGVKPLRVYVVPPEKVLVTILSRPEFTGTAYIL
jgi:hypothetical protein